VGVLAVGVEWRTLVHPNGKAEMITAPPFEAAGAFLSVECGSQRVAAYLLEHLAEFLEGRCDRVAMTFNLFSLEGVSAEVTITEDEDLSPAAPRSCRLSIVEFRNLLVTWSKFLESQQWHSD